MIVEEYFKIDEDKLFGLSDVSEYWEKVYTFYVDVKGCDLKLISSNMLDWLETIEENHGAEYKRFCGE